MKVTFVIPVKIEKDVDCFGCDFCEGEDVVRRGGFFGLKKETVRLYKCKKLKIPLDSENLNSDRMPCDAKDWQQTNRDFPITDEVFTLNLRRVKP